MSRITEVALDLLKKYQNSQKQDEEEEKEESYAEIAARLEKEYPAKPTAQQTPQKESYAQMAARLEKEYSPQKNAERTQAVSNWATRYNSLVQNAVDYANQGVFAGTKKTRDGYITEIDSLINDYEGIREYADMYGVANSTQYLQYLKDLRRNLEILPAANAVSLLGWTAGAGMYQDPKIAENAAMYEQNHTGLIEDVVAGRANLSDYPGILNGEEAKELVTRMQNEGKMPVYETPGVLESHEAQAERFQKMYDAGWRPPKYNGTSLGDAAKASWGVTMSTVKAGLGNFSKGIMSTLDNTVGAGLEKLGWKNNPISQLADQVDAEYAAIKREQAQALYDAGFEQGDKFVNAITGILEQSVASYPHLLLMLYTNGASAGASATSLMANAAAQTASAATLARMATTQMLKSPQFQLSLARTLGTDYEEAKEAGASDLAAGFYAVLSSFTNAGIEIGITGQSGIQGLPQKSGSALLAWIESSLEEGGEEILQGIVSDALAKVIYDGERQVLDAKKMLINGSMGTAVGATMGGGNIVAESVVSKFAGGNSVQDSDAEKPAPVTEDQPRNTLREAVWDVMDQHTVQNEAAKTKQAYTADLAKYDEKQRAVIQKAIDSGVLNNTSTTHHFVDWVAKISADKGVPFDFANNQKLKESGFALEGKTVNGLVSPNGITLNVQAAKALNKVVGHEITHVMEGTDLYDEMQQVLFDLAKKKGEYQTRYDALTKLYEGIQDADITKELTADLVGDYLFTDAEFIKHLSVNHRNIFQRIYDEIKYLCRVATAGSKELRQLEKVKKAFEAAYRAEGKVQVHTQYSIGEIIGENGNSFGVGVHLDSTLLDDLTPSERIGMVKEYVKELGGAAFTAYDNNGNAVDVTIAKPGERFRNKNGKQIPINKDLTTKHIGNEVKQEAIALIDELIVTAEYDGSRPSGYPHGRLDNNGQNNWEYWTTYIEDKNNTIWEATLNIANTADGQKVLYDISPIKKAGRSVKSDTLPAKNNISQAPSAVKTQFSVSNEGEYAETFYSQMGKVVEGVKQEKLGAASVVNMLRGKGVKAEEIKWSGIEEWLEGKKSVTKAELQEFIAGSQLQIEETVLDGKGDANIEVKKHSRKEFGLYGNGKLVDTIRKNDSGYWSPSARPRVSFESQSDMVAYGKRLFRNSHKWSHYQLNGGNNYREILFNLPRSAYSNGAMIGHWGKNAQGILAHARIQDFDVNGQKMLFIEEIQSDWHNEGHNYGYVAEGQKLDTDIQNDTVEAYRDFVNSDVMKDIANRMESNGHKDALSVFKRLFDGEQFAYYTILDYAGDLSKQELSFINKVASEEANRKADIKKAPTAKSVPDAPFKDTYHEFVLKRLIREAAENGYDSIGWTTADIQSQRWSDKYAEGYRIEYDQDIPKFLNKYGKKWGAQVGKTTLEDGTEVWSMPITEEMKQSVLHEGQPLYSISEDGSTANEQYSLQDSDGEYNVYGREIALQEKQPMADRPGGQSLREAVWDVMDKAKKNPTQGKQTDSGAVGAAEQNFSGKASYQDLLTDENTQPDRPGDVRPVEVPKTDGYGRKVSENVGNAYGAEITPDQMASRIEELVADGALGFDIRSNQQSMETAAKAIKDKGASATKRSITQNVANGKLKDGDIEKAMLLYAAYANQNTQDAQDNAAELMVDLATMANMTGRNLQLFKVLRKMTPQGQVMAVQKSIDRYVEQLNSKRGKNNQVSISVPQELMEQYEEAARKDLQEKTAESEKKKADIEDAIYKAAAAQIKASPMEKLRAWRYMAMLGNAKTQARNFMGNALFRPLVNAKRTIGASLEAMFLEQDKRTKAVLGFGKESTDLLDWAKADAKKANVKKLFSYSAKTGDSARSQIEDNRKIYDTKWLEATREFVQKVPEAADNLFKRREYAVSLASFLKARGYKMGDRITADVLNEAREYAAQEALKATFNDMNDFSNMIVKMRYKGDNPAGKAMNMLGEGALPFRRTPANILVRGVEYSPVNIVRSVYNMATKVRSGEMSAATAIDQMASGLTGTGLMALGYVLAQGLFGFKLVGNEDDKDKKNAGHQSYAIETPKVRFSVFGYNLEIGSKSFTVDWAAPANLPVFVGANLYNAWKDKDPDTGWLMSTLSASAKTLEPMLELSCLSSLNDLIHDVSYADEDMRPYTLVSSMATSYLNQFIPTLFGQVEQTFEPEKTQVYSDADDPVQRRLETALGQMTRKLPGDLFQAKKYDAWGKEEKTSDWFESFINPSYVSEMSDDPVDAEIMRLNDAQDVNVTVKKPAKTLSFTDKNGEKHTDQRLTARQWEVMQKEYGQTAHSVLTELMDNTSYEAMTDAQKAEAFRLAYDYARETARIAAVEGYPGYSDSWMEGIENNRADSIIQKITMDSMSEAITGLTKAWKYGRDDTEAVRAIEEAYTLYSNLTGSQAKEVRRESSGRVAGCYAAMAEDMDAQTFAKLYQTYYEISGSDNKPAQKANSWAAELQKAKEKGLITNRQKQVMKENFTFSSGFTVQTDKFDQLVNSGLSSKNSSYVMDIIANLKPSPGRSTVSDVQEAEALAKSNLSEKDKQAAMMLYLSDSQDENLKQMVAKGYSSEDYAHVYRIYYDQDQKGGKGTKACTIAEIQKTLGCSYSTAEAVYKIYAP